MSLTGQYAHRGPHDTVVQEFGYGLGPPTGILVLRHLAGDTPLRFPEARDDHRHQLFWADDGVLAVRRGSATAHLGRGEAFWVRRGTEVEVVTCEPCTVHVVCLRLAPRHLEAVPAGTVVMGDEASATVRALCDPATTEEEGADARERLLASLPAPVPLEQVAGGGAYATMAGRGTGPARQVATALLADPGDPTELAEWAQRLHTTTKTLQRDFVREYGCSWSAWRTRTRLQASTALLGRMTVAEVAHRVGYAGASSYVQAFRRAYGTTPGSWALRA